MVAGVPPKKVGNQQADELAGGQGVLAGLAIVKGGAQSVAGHLVARQEDESGNAKGHPYGQDERGEGKEWRMENGE